MIARRAAAVAIASAIVLAIVTARTGQSLFSDPAAQFKTVLQVLSGESPRLNTWTRPDFDDLARDRSEPLGWWAPGTPLFAFPLMRAGVTAAATARALAVLMLVAGAAGWARWFALFDLPGPIVLALAALLPWTRDASNALFQFSGEVLVFAVVPWVLLATVAAERRGRLSTWIAVGLFAGSLYIIKYSASFVTAGIAALLLWRAFRDRGQRVAILFAFSAGAAIPILALTVFNSSIGTANLLSASLGGGFSWRLLLHALGLSGLAAADLDAVVRWLLMHPTHAVTQNPAWLSVIGLPGGLLLVLATARAASRSDAAALARAVFATTLVCIVVVWTISTGVSVEPRHVASAAVCLLSLALAEGLRIAATAPRLRVAVTAASLLYVAAPLAYGPVSVAAKVRRFPADFHAGTTGFYNPLLAESDVASVVARLERGFQPQTDVWYTTDPLTPLDLRGRALMIHADFIALDELRKYRFVTLSRSLRVHVLLPPRFELNGKGAVIRQSFPQAVAWRREPIAGSQYDRWLADLRPEGY